MDLKMYSEKSNKAQDEQTQLTYNMKKSNYFLISGVFFFAVSCVLLILKAYDIANEESYQIKQILLVISTILYVASLIVYSVMRF